MIPVWFDSHCHVHFHAFKDDMHKIAQTSLDKGVWMVTVGTQQKTSKDAITFAHAHDGVWGTVGLHPNHTVEQEFWDEDELDTHEEGTDPQKIKTRCETFDADYYLPLARDTKCVAIGETGLDYYRIPESADVEQVKEKQRQTVQAHFTLATQVHKPVSIHCRDAYPQQAEMIREALLHGQLAKRGVIHCFTGTLEEARAFLDLGFYISFSGIVTFSKTLMEVAKNIPLERMLIETDAPYLTPHPQRGTRNEPWKVQLVGQKIAELKGIDVNQVAQMTTKNALTLFDLQNNGDKE